jgi:tetratricopeptide (TPR) repeat protein
MKTLPMFRRVRRALPAILLLLAAGAVRAQDVMGAIVTRDDKRFEGKIVYRAVANVYVVSQSRGSGATVDVEISPAQVKDLVIPEPPGLREAVKAVQDGKTAQAIPVMEAVSQKYAMLRWDDIAGRWLAEAYMKEGKAAETVRACDRVIAANKEAAYKGEMAPLYWQALRKVQRTAKLEDLLDQAVKSGSAEAAAFALIVRGDLLTDKGDNKAALKDGYLRVVTLFRAVRTAQAEALFKAAKAFEQINQGSRAEEMRKRLLTDFGTSTWAQQVKGG